MSRLFGAWLFICLIAAGDASAQTISTYAGGGIGDGGPAVDAYMRRSGGMVLDAAGNLYIADDYGHRVRRVDTNGIITTVAGNGTASFSGDGGPAISAGLNRPRDVAVDSAGNLYIADGSNRRVRKVTPTGVITTVAGDGTDTFADNVVATTAGFGTVIGLAVDAAGNVYIADSAQHRVRRLSTGGMISTVAGNGTAGYSGDGGLGWNASLSSPSDVAFDGAGNLHIADSANNVIRKLASNGVISTALGGGTDDGQNAWYTDAKLHWPSSIGFDATGALYIGEYTGYRIRRLFGELVHTVVGNGREGTPAGDGGSALSATLGYVTRIEVAPDGRIFIMDALRGPLRVAVSVDQGDWIERFAGGGYGEGPVATSAFLDLPRHVAAGADGTVVLSTRHFLHKITPEGAISTLAGRPGYGMGIVGAVVIDDTGEVHYSDVGSQRIHRIGVDGIEHEVARVSGLTGGLARDPAGNFYVSHGHTIKKVTPAGTISEYAGTGAAGFSGDGGPALQATFDTIGALFHGPDALYAVDRGNFRVRRIGSDGVVTTVAGNGGSTYSGAGTATQVAISEVSSLAADVEGNLYLGHAGSHRLLKLTPWGQLVEFAGAGTPGFSGDGGPAPDAQFNLVSGVAVMPVAGGDIFVTDEGNQRVRRISMASSPTVPDAPAAPVAVAGDGTAEVSFAPPASDGGSPVTGYVVTSSPAGGVDANAGTLSLSRVLTGLTNGTNYQFTVRAINAVGPSAASNPSAPVVPQPEVIPPVLTVPEAPGAPVAVAGDGAAEVSFAPPSDDGGSPITGYVVTSIPAGGVDAATGTLSLNRVLTGLTNGTSYRFTVRAINAVGSSAASAPSTPVVPSPVVIPPVETVPAAPGAPVTVAGDGTAEVSFAPPASDGGSPITGYVVTSSPAGGVDANAGTLSLNRVLTGLTNGTSYQFTVRAINVVGPSAASAPSAPVVPQPEVIPPVLTVPEAPGAPVAVAGDSTAEISFTPPANDGGSPVTGYVVTSSPTGGVDAAAGTLSLNRVLTGLTNGTSYRFTVRAINAVGSSPDSDPSAAVVPQPEVIPPVLTVPEAPSAPVAVAGDGAAEVSFAPPSDDGGSPITGYVVTSIPAGGLDSGIGTLSLNRVLTGLTNGTSYQFTVRAINAVGPSAASVPSAPVVPHPVVIPPVETVPAAPGAPVAVAGDGTAEVSFAPPSDDGGSPITGYVVTSIPAGGVDANAGTLSLNRVLTGLTNGTSYQFTVRAINAVGPSPDSDRSAAVVPRPVVTPPVETVPAAPAAPVAVAGDGTAEVSFVPPSDDGGSPITGYVVTSIPAGGVDANAGTLSLNRVLTGLTNGTSYQFTVRAINAVGSSAASAPSAPVVPRPVVVPPVETVPAAPAAPVAVAGDGTAEVSFAPPASDGGSPITGYVVTSSPAGGVDAATGTLSLNRVLTGLTNGTSYRFTVRAINAVGSSAASAPSAPVVPRAVVTPPVETVPNAPAAPVAVAGDGTAEVSFAPPANDGGSPITGYVVTSSPAGGVDANAGTLSLNRVLTGLTNGTSYRFTVRAINAVGSSAASAPSAPVVPRPVVTPPVETVPDAPAAPVAVAGDGTAEVSFAPPSDDGGSPITGYVVTSSPAGGVDANAGTLSLNRVLTGLTNGTSYRFTVRAINAVGSSAASAPSAPVVPRPVVTPPVLSVAPASGVEGSQARFVVRLSEASIDAVRFNLRTVDGTASAGSDFTGLTLVNQVIPVGRTTLDIPVDLLLDAIDEDSETFTVVVDNVTGAVLGTAQAVGTIENREEPPALVLATRADRFEQLENSAPSLLDVLRNDVFAPSRLQSGKVTITEAPLHGVAEVSESNTPGTAHDDTIRYTPPADFSGEDVFAYQVCDVDDQCHESMVTVVLRPVPRTVIESAKNVGSTTVPLSGLRPLEGTDFKATPFTAPVFASHSPGRDDTPWTPWDGGQAGTGMSLHTLTAPADGLPRSYRVLVELVPLLQSGFDLYVGVDNNGDGRASEDELRCTSAQVGSVEETCDFALEHPGTGSVTYWVLAHNIDADVAHANTYAFAVPMVPGNDSLVATGPATLARGEQGSAIIGWADLKHMNGGRRRGFVRMHANGGQPIGMFPFGVNRTGSDSASVMLESGVTRVVRLVDGEAQDRMFIDVPAGASSLTVSFTAATRVTVYLSQGVAQQGILVAPAPSRSQALMSANGNNGILRTLTVSGSQLQPGRWYVTPVNGSGTGSAAEVTVTATVTGAAPTIRPGSYFNAARSGHGLFLYPAADQRVGIWYTYLTDGTPTWYYLQGPEPGANGLWTSPIYRSVWNGTGNKLTSVGRAVIVPSGPDTFRFSYSLDGEVGSEPMAALGRGCPMVGGRQLDSSSHWFDPVRAGTGYSVQYFPDYEFYAAFVYDRQGIARYLLAERSGAGGTVETLALEQNTGFCPTCERVGTPARSVVGTLQRTISGGALTGLSANAQYIGLVPGAWSAQDAVQPLGGPGTTQGCGL